MDRITRRQSNQGLGVECAPSRRRILFFESNRAYHPSETRPRRVFRLWRRANQDPLDPRTAAGSLDAGRALIGVPRFPLVPDAMDDHLVGRRVVVIQRHVAGSAAGNQQLVQAGFRRPADQRVILEGPQRACDQRAGRVDMFRVVFAQEERKAVEVFGGRSREGDRGQEAGYLARFTFVGRKAGALRPLAMARKRCMTSSNP